MPLVATSIEINASPKAVFDWLIEPDLLARWLGGFVGSEPITDGGARLGARSRDTIREGSRTFVLDTEIVGFEPGRRLAVRIEAKGLHQTDTYELIPQGGVTRLEYRSDTRLSGMTRLLTPFVAPQLRARAERDLARLKDEVETGE